MPHFEKMLYDQAQLACVYTDAYTLKKSPDLARVVRDILTYVNESLSDPSGGFYRYLIGIFLFYALNKKITIIIQVRRMRIRCQNMDRRRNEKEPFVFGLMTMYIHFCLRYPVPLMRR